MTIGEWRLENGDCGSGIRGAGRCLLLGLLAGAVFATSALAQELPRALPEEVGLSSERLERLNAIMQGFVDRGQAAGIVTLIVRHGKIAHLASVGHADRDVAMADDAIFRIASQTKAVTSVAIMMLVEEGKLALTDPVARHIPAFAKTTVAVPPENGNINVALVPADRAITIRDLLTHTSGISYGTAFLPQVSIQLVEIIVVAAVAGVGAPLEKHVAHDTVRFHSIRVCRAAILAVSRSAGMWSPVPKYISSGAALPRS